MDRLVDIFMQSDRTYIGRKHSFEIAEFDL